MGTARSARRTAITLRVVSQHQVFTETSAHPPATLPAPKRDRSLWQQTPWPYYGLWSTQEVVFLS